MNLFNNLFKKKNKSNKHYYGIVDENENPVKVRNNIKIINIDIAKIMNDAGSMPNEINKKENHMTLDERFKDFIIKNRDQIEFPVCDLICDNKMCPTCEGVPCGECMNYVHEILIEENKRYL